MLCTSHTVQCAVRKSTFFVLQVLVFVFPPQVILNLVPAISRHTENVWIVFSCYLSHSKCQISHYELCSRFPNILMLSKWRHTEDRQALRDKDQASLGCFFILTLWWPPQIGQNSYGLDIINNNNQTHIISDKYSRIPNLTLPSNFDIIFLIFLNFDIDNFYFLKNWNSW